MSLAELLHLQQELINANEIGEFFLYEHPEYLEDDFYPEDRFEWPAGHSDYPDLTKNDEAEDDEENDDASLDKYLFSDDSSIGSDEEEGRELDIIDPIHHPVHFFPDKPEGKEYTSIDPTHHYDVYPDDGPPTESEKMHLSHNYDGELINRDAVPEHILYHPMSPSEHHPLPVNYGVLIPESDGVEPINPLHPLDPTRRTFHNQELDEAPSIEPVKKFVDYYGAHFL